MNFENDMVARLSHADPAVRRLAVLDLPDSDEDDIAALLVTALADPDAGVRAEAAKALEGYEEDETVAPLARLLADQDASVRAAAGDTLAELKTTAAGRHLLPYLNHGEPETSMRALRAIRALRLPEALEPAIALVAHGDAGVRREAAGVLGYLKHPDALPVLAQTASYDSDADVRRVANAVFRRENLVACAVGPLSGLEKKLRAAVESAL